MLSKICHFKSFPIVAGLFCALLSETALAWPPTREESDHDYKRYIQRCRDEAGTTTVNGRSHPNLVEFTVESDTQAPPHQTVVKARRSYFDGHNLHHVIGEVTLQFPHIKGEEHTISDAKHYLDDEGTLFFSNTLVTDYARPPIPEITGLRAPLHYTQHQEFLREPVNIFGLCVKQNGRVIARPNCGYYNLKQSSRQSTPSPYIYSTGESLFLVKLISSIFDFVGRVPNLDFSYAEQTSHELIVKHGWNLEISSGGATVSEPYSDLTRGIYKQEDGRWIQVDKAMRPLATSKTDVFDNKQEPGFSGG